MVSIAVIGLGNIGQRHIQSMLTLKEQIKIYAVDNSTEVISKMKEQYQDTRLYWTSNMTELPSQIDIAIIATASRVRYKVFKQLEKSTEVKNIIFEKVLFQSISEYDAVAEILAKKGIKAWVNCARREWKDYQWLKQELRDTEDITINIYGSQWGLGCNGIHMLDLIAYVAGTDNISVDISQLDNEVIESKRSGYKEITGTVSGRMGKCKGYTITCAKMGDAPITIQVNSRNFCCMVEETRGTLRYMSSKTEWKWKEKGFTVEYQSQLTERVVQDILYKNSSNLPEFNVSEQVHKALLSELIPWFEMRGGEKGICPIT